MADAVRDAWLESTNDAETERVVEFAGLPLSTRQPCRRLPSRTVHFDRAIAPRLEWGSMDIMARVCRVVDSARVIEAPDRRDDEVQYVPEDLERLMEAYRRDPEATLACLDDFIWAGVEASDPQGDVTPFYRARTANFLRARLEGIAAKSLTFDADGNSTIDSRPVVEDPWSD